MAEPFPESHKDLLGPEKAAFAVLATLMPDGTPHATPVWFDTENGLLRVNTIRGRVKDLNMRKRPNIAMTILDPGSPYRYMLIRGKVEERTEKGAMEHIDELALRYTGDRRGPKPEGAVRVIYKIRPNTVVVQG